MKLFKPCACADRRRCRHPFWFRVQLLGRDYRRSTRTANRALAGRIAAKKYNLILEGREGLRRPKAPPLSKHVEAYGIWATSNHPASASKDTRVLGQFLEAVGDKRLDQISVFDIERWKTQRAKEVSRSTVNRELTVLRGCFSRAMAWGRLERSPLVSIKDYTVDDTRLRVLDADELRTLLTQGAPDLVLLCRVTLECLPRLSEVLGLRREHIGGRWIEIRRKGGRVERVAVTPELRADLLRRCHTSGWVFGQGAKGKPPHREAVSVAMTRQMRSVGLPGVSHHTMRHTGVTLMLEAGINPRVIQRLAGWTSLRMLERYGHVRDAEALRAVTTVRRLLDAAQHDGKPAQTVRSEGDN